MISVALGNRKSGRVDRRLVTSADPAHFGSWRRRRRLGLTVTVEPPQSGPTIGASSQWSSAFSPPAIALCTLSLLKFDYTFQFTDP